MRANKHFWAAAGATAAVVIAVVLGFLSLGSPNEQRLARADEQRIAALSRLAGEVNGRWRAEKHTLPASLSGVSANAPKDPMTGAPYEYRAIGPNQYELCATFARDNRKEAARSQSEFWAHPKGHYCFMLEASQPAPVYYPFPY